MERIGQSIKIIYFLLIWAFVPLVVSGQNWKNTYFNVDWQINTPFSTDFADKTSGWGLNAEGGYYVLPNLGLGLFFSYHSNNKYIDRQTIDISNTSVVTSDQQHAIFQIPFGAAARYSFTRLGVCQPYFGTRLGANYSEISSYLNVWKVYEKEWGFYVSPEIGMNLFVVPQRSFGLHIALYYSYATNKTTVLNYTIDGINNWGVRVGAAF